MSLAGHSTQNLVLNTAHDQVSRLELSLLVTPPRFSPVTLREWVGIGTIRSAATKRLSALGRRLGAVRPRDEVFDDA
jgi:hypothetical protein